MTRVRFPSPAPVFSVTIIAGDRREPTSRIEGAQRCLLRLDRLATTIGLHVPSAVARSDEAILGSDRGIAKNIGVVNRINAIKAARHDMSTSVAPVADIFLPVCGRSDRNAECDDAEQHDEIHFSNHGGLLLRAGYLMIDGVRHFSLIQFALSQNCAMQRMPSAPTARASSAP